MSKSYLTNKGIGYWVSDSFHADLARFWDHRTEKPYFLDSEIINEVDMELLGAIKEYTNLPANEIRDFMDHIKDILKPKENALIQSVYKDGFQDGVRMILQSLIGHIKPSVLQYLRVQGDGISSPFRFPSF